MSDLKNRLIVLSKWLIESDRPYIDSYTDGYLERAIKSAQQEMKHDIGDMIKEILEADEHTIENEIEIINTPKPKLPF